MNDNDRPAEREDAKLVGFRLHLAKQTSVPDTTVMGEGCVLLEAFPAWKQVDCLSSPPLFLSLSLNEFSTDQFPLLYWQSNQTNLSFCNADVYY